MASASETVRAGGPVLIGCHICGNTDWGMVMDTGIDIVNFDAHAVMEQFSLYPKQLRAFLEKGGLVAWGIVPAQGFDPNIKAARLAARLKEGFTALDKKGVPYELTAERAMLSTACGLGGLTPDLARGALKTLAEVSALLMS
jgi:methionine synthase II (cobalamin-independent)